MSDINKLPHKNSGKHGRDRKVFGFSYSLIWACLTPISYLAKTVGSVVGMEKYLVFFDLGMFDPNKFPHKNSGKCGRDGKVFCISYSLIWVCLTPISSLTKTVGSLIGMEKYLVFHIL